MLTLRHTREDSFWPCGPRGPTTTSGLVAHVGRKFWPCGTQERIYWPRGAQGQKIRALGATSTMLGGRLVQEGLPRTVGPARPVSWPGMDGPGWTAREGAPGMDGPG